MPSRFDLDLLHTLVVIADAGSLTAAAPRLCRSQSAVSEQIRKLEQACGLPLLHRSKSGVSLTPAGQRLRDHARQLLAFSETAYRDMQSSLLTGDLRLAITDYFKPASITMILKRLRDHYPQLRLHVSILRSARIEMEAGSGDFDIGLSMRFLDMPVEEGGVPSDDGRIRLRREPLKWVAHRSTDISSLNRLPLIVMTDACSLRRLVVKSLDRHGVDFEIAHSASGVMGMQMALSAGLGISCLNASAIPPEMVSLDEDPRLPEMPDAEFSLLPPRTGEAIVVTEVRQMLAEQFA